MKHTTWTIIRRTGISALPLAYALWTAIPVYADPADAADLTSVRAHA